MPLAGTSIVPPRGIEPCPSIDDNLRDDEVVNGLQPEFNRLALRRHVTGMTSNTAYPKSTVAVTVYVPGASPVSTATPSVSRVTGPAALATIPNSGSPSV